MDWIRRNWPDLLIGLGLLAVIAGIVATLLTGGSFFPLGQGERQASASPPRPPTAQVSPSSPAPVPGQGTQAEESQPAQVEAPAETSGEIGADGDITLPSLPTITQQEPAAEAGTEPGAEAGAEAQAGEAQAGDVEPAAESQAVVALRPGEAGSTNRPDAAAGTTATAAPQQPVQPAAQAATPAAASSAAGSDPDPSAPFRVSVGSFRDADNAGRQAELFRQAGYPVFIAAQGELSLVLLGPYRLETEAERARTEVASGGYDVQPIVYTFRPQGEPAASAPAAAPAASPAAAQSTATPSTAAPSAEAAGRYLQAGAYSSMENAQIQRAAIEELGFRVNVQMEGTLLRVLVGPYGDSDLAAAQSSLARQGIDNIPR